jgi:hypothetical protein
MPSYRSPNPASAVVSTRVEPQVLKRIYQLAERDGTTASGVTRHLITLGLEQIQTAA